MTANMDQRAVEIDLAAIEAAGPSAKAMETRLSPTDIVIWLMFGILLALAVSHFRQFCEDR